MRANETQGRERTVVFFLTQYAKKWREGLVKDKLEEKDIFFYKMLEDKSRMPRV